MSALFRAIGWLMLAANAEAAVPDLLQTTPNTGIYVETDYLDLEAAHCDWYFRAQDFLDARVPAGSEVCPVIVRIRGTLNQQGARLFWNTTRQLARWPVKVTRIVLNSKGGESTAALQIAGIIRDHEVYRRRDGGVLTALDESETAVCFSACLLVFAAGFERHAEFDEYNDPSLPSRLGIHRPGQYDRSSGEYDSKPDNRDIRRVRRQLEAYFDSVGVRRELVDAMFAVPFDQIRLLTRDEAQHFGLVTTTR
jgi:hypothetical protein